MPEKVARRKHLNQIELDIARAFGWSIIVYEESLYGRFLQISADSSLISRDEFRRHLRMMEAKGYVVSLDMHGHRAYRRMLVEEDIGVSLTPSSPLAELKLAHGSREIRMRKRTPPAIPVTKDIVHESEELGQYVLDLIENYLKYKYGTKNIKKSVLHGYLRKYVQALGQSQDTFFGFIENNTPEMMNNFRRLLETKGQDKLLLGLRLAESGIRQYS